jgi:hypothetical protein
LFLGEIMLKYLYLFLFLTSLFFTACSSNSNASENSPIIKKQSEIKCPECPKCPEVSKKKKTKKKRKQCKPKIVYKESDKLIIGEMENVYLPKYKISYKARIDTGAKTSSLHAQNIVEFEREGKRWVKFEIIDNNKQVIKIEKPIKRIVKIKEGEGERDRRYVVNMKFNISTVSYFGEINLTDRSDLEFPVLIGRNFIRGNTIVDVSKKFTQKLIKDEK